ncbi:ABC transporter permease [Sulfurimonas hydrogeniphila]|uniref:ABC transporter permease n=1 Tax=Sulfurimonas TaxID=202746 RepID=UPI00125F8C89|nr:ABC transporter permease [Sulfurimonas hydrogeniphila]
MSHIKNLWKYRHYILTSIKSEFVTKFIRSKLGGLWIVLNPLAQVAIYALVLSAVLAAKLPGIDSKYAYAIYLMAGILGWNLFFEIITRMTNVFVENANLLKKMAFPKMTLPLIIIGSAIINNILLFFSILLVFGLLGHTISTAVIWIIPLTLITVFLGASMGLFLGIVNVFIRDTQQIVPIILQFWFWLTPIVYSWSIIPQKYLYLVMLNPLSGIIQGYQNILVYNKQPELSVLFYPLVLGTFIAMLSLYMYARANEEMADVL